MSEYPTHGLTVSMYACVLTMYVSAVALSSLSPLELGTAYRPRQGPRGPD